MQTASQCWKAAVVILSFLWHRSNIVVSSCWEVAATHVPPAALRPLLVILWPQINNGPILKPYQILDNDIFTHVLHVVLLLPQHCTVATTPVPPAALWPLLVTPIWPHFKAALVWKHRFLIIVIFQLLYVMCYVSLFWCYNIAWSHLKPHQFENTDSENESPLLCC